MRNYLDLKKALDKKFNRDVKLVEIAKAIETSAQNFNKKFKNQNTEVTLSDVRKVEKYFNVKLIESTAGDNIINIPYWSKLPNELKIPDFAFVTAERNVIKNHWHLDPEYLRIVTMVGDKMTNYWYKINENDILIIDTSHNFIRGNGVYFATSRNNTRFWIREMQALINDDIQIKGFAPSGETTKVFTQEQLKQVDFKIIGKVIKNVSFRL